MTDRRPNGLPLLQQGSPIDAKPPIHQFNGAHSSQSSRSSSPGSRTQPVQSPVNRVIPASQLPPSRPPLTQVSPSRHPAGYAATRPISTSAPIGALKINSNSTKDDLGISNETFAPVVNDNSAKIYAQQPIHEGNVPASPQRSSQVTYGQYSNDPTQILQKQPIAQNAEFSPNVLKNHTGGALNVAKSDPVSSNEIFAAPGRTTSSYFGEVLPKQPVVDIQSAFNRNVPANSGQLSYGGLASPYSNDTAQVLPQHVIPQTNELNSQLAKNEGGSKIPLNAPASVPSNSIANASPYFPQPPRNVNAIPQPQSTFNRNAPANPQAMMNSNRMPYSGVYSHAPNVPKVTQQIGALKINHNQARINPTDNSTPYYSNSVPQIRPTYNQNLPIRPLAPTNSTQTAYEPNRQPPLPQNALNATQNTPYNPAIDNRKANLHSNRYPMSIGDYREFTQPNQQFDLLQQPNVLPPIKEEPPAVHLGEQTFNEANCSPDLFRCTLTNIPESHSLLQKSRLPFGLLIHPFRDLAHLPVIQCNVIVRCRACRTYINPFVTFADQKRWKCNLCYRINELPEEFQYDPLTKTYGDPSRRPEIRSSTLEYIAPAEYMLRPPQPAVYLYLFDLSRGGVETGYLNLVCDVLLEELGSMPGDARTQIGFIGFDSALHFYSMSEGANQPHEMTVVDIEDAFIPTPDDLLVNLNDRQDLIVDLLRLLPRRFARTADTSSCLGAALQVAYKLVGSTGGRITVLAASLPDVGPGKLTNRDDQQTNGQLSDTSKLNPANDFYKKMALECSAQQIAVDLFVLTDRYVDLATVSGISRFTGGQIQRFPLLKATPNRNASANDSSVNGAARESFARSFRRYVTRKIGFEAVMRVRCSRGLSVHSFHGNFFVRSTDLLSLPNVNPDAGFGMQITIDENLTDVRTACFQCALLYTSSKGERRIRVHTLCLPVVKSLTEVINSADQECVVGLLAKMAVDRSLTSGLTDAREAFVNAVIDVLTAFKVSLNAGTAPSGLVAPNCLKLMPLYVMSLLKNRAFRTDRSIKLDERLNRMMEMKTKPLYMLLLEIYPDLYPVDDLASQPLISTDEGDAVNVPVRLQLTARCLRNEGIFLMDTGEKMVVLVCPNASQETLKQMLDVSNYQGLTGVCDIPELENDVNRRLRRFIDYLNEDRPFRATVEVIRDDSPNRVEFFERLVEDRGENALSYYEFLQHVKTQVK